MNRYIERLKGTKLQMSVLMNGAWITFYPGVQDKLIQQGLIKPNENGDPEISLEHIEEIKEATRQARSDTRKKPFYRLRVKQFRDAKGSMEEMSSNNSLKKVASEEALNPSPKAKENSSSVPYMIPLSPSEIEALRAEFLAEDTEERTEFYRQMLRDLGETPLG